MLDVLRWGDQDNPDSLIVLCHGIGADAEQMALFAPDIIAALPRAALLAPTAPEVMDQATRRYQWFSLASLNPFILSSLARAAAPALEATIAAEADRLKIPPNRIVIAGFSQGAMMALEAGLARAHPPAAILAYAGAMLSPPPRRATATATGGPTVLLVHGTADTVVPFFAATATQAALTPLGIPIETCWCQGTGHTVDQQGLEAGIALLRRALPAP